MSHEKTLKMAQVRGCLYLGHKGVNFGSENQEEAISQYVQTKRATHLILCPRLMFIVFKLFSFLMDPLLQRSSSIFGLFTTLAQPNSSSAFQRSHNLNLKKRTMSADTKTALVGL